MRSLEIFVAAYEERSFTQAAVREGATQSGVSQHVRNLEARHGVLLFRREKGRVLPTPAADDFYRHCLQALRASDQAFQRLRQFSFGLSGEARLGLMPTLNAAALAPALMAFRQHHPNVKVSVTEAYSAALVDMVLGGALDVAVVPAMPAVQGLRISAFMTTPEMMVRARPRGQAQAPLPARPAELGPLKLILPEAANVRAETVRSYLVAQGAEIADMIEMNSMLGTLDLIARSDWCAVLPALLMASRTYSDIFEVRPLDPPMALDLVLVESAACAQSAAVEAFCALLHNQATALLASPHQDG